MSYENLSESTPRIAFLAYQGPNQSDGGVSSLSHILSGLVPERCLILTFGSAQRNLTWQRRGFTVYQLEHWRHASGSLKRVKTWFTSNIRVRRIIRRADVDIIHINDIKALEQSCSVLTRVKARKLLNIRDIKQEHETYGLKWQLGVLSVDHVLALSHEMVNELAARLPLVPDQGIQPLPSVPPRDRILGALLNKRVTISYVYSAVPWVAEPVGPEPRIHPKDAWHDAGPCILYVGAICEKKNQLAFLSRCARAILDLTNAHICFLGDFKPESDSYCRACREEKAKFPEPSRIQFLGHVNDVRPCYKAATLTVLASKREGLPRSIIESMAAGTPVATFDVTSAREVVGATGSGLVVPQGDYSALKEAVLDILRSETLRNDMAANASTAAGVLFDPRSIRADYLALCRRLISGR